MDEPSPTPDTSNHSAEALLNHLICLLLQRNECTKAWLNALETDPADPMDASARVKRMIRLGAVAEVGSALMTKVTAAMARANNLVWSPEYVEKWIEVIYKDRQRRVDFDNAIARGLPPPE